MMEIIISFFLGCAVGVITGVALMCIVSVNDKDSREDEAQIEYIKKREEEHKK